MLPQCGGIPRGAGDAVQTKSSQFNIISSHRPFTLIYLNKNTRLIIEYVENVCDFSAGIVVLRSIRAVITPPAVSIPTDSDTSSKRISRVFSLSTPLKIAPEL